MSDASSPPLEREALQKKDREELQTIAAALGGKPGSRARKAEIVDLILELTGVSGGGSGDERSGGEQAGTQQDQKGGDEKGGDQRDKKDDKAADQKAGDQKAGDQKGGHQKGERSGGDGQKGPTRQGPSSKGDAPKGESSKGESSKGDAPKGDSAKRDDATGRDDDGEGGNRRRRRRGRGRGDQQQEEYTGEPIPVQGVLDTQKEGFGFLRTVGLLPSRDDVYVSVRQIRQFGLRPGDVVAGGSRPAFRNEKNPALLHIDTVNGLDAEKAKGRASFEDLTPLFPDEKLTLELARNPDDVTARIVDLIAPIGKGQRGMIVSPPKAGKTTIMKQIARSIETNAPDVELIILLVDERPEEVTDMRRSVERADVIGSTFDRPTDEHCRVAELTIERAKRMVESGHDVVLVLDGITRLARAYNMAGPSTGRLMSGGLDTGAIYPPKKFFGAARNLEEGGSLTILATALVETGSRMDEVIFEEFKGTGNMELRLDRRLAERRIFPAIDVDASSTRHEELLFDKKELDLVWKLRRALHAVATEGGETGLELLIDRMRSFKSNEDFLAEFAKT